MSCFMYTDIHAIQAEACDISKSVSIVMTFEVDSMNV
jgi:hypothetical protein